MNKVVCAHYHVQHYSSIQGHVDDEDQAIRRWRNQDARLIKIDILVAKFHGGDFQRHGPEGAGDGGDEESELSTTDRCTYSSSKNLQNRHYNCRSMQYAVKKRGLELSEA